MELLQRRSHGPVPADAAGVAVEVDVGDAVQGVVAEGADHRGPHHAVVAVGDAVASRGKRGLIVTCAVKSLVDVLPATADLPLHQRGWGRLSTPNRIEAALRSFSEIRQLAANLLLSRRITDLSDRSYRDAC